MPEDTGAEPSTPNIRNGRITFPHVQRNQPAVLYQWTVTSSIARGTGGGLGRADVKDCYESGDIEAASSSFRAVVRDDLK